MNVIEVEVRMAVDRVKETRIEKLNKDTKVKLEVHPHSKDLINVKTTVDEAKLGDRTEDATFNLPVVQCKFDILSILT